MNNKLIFPLIALLICTVACSQNQVLLLLDASVAAVEVALPALQQGGVINANEAAAAEALANDSLGASQSCGAALKSSSTDASKIGTCISAYQPITTFAVSTIKDPKVRVIVTSIVSAATAFLSALQTSATVAATQQHKYELLADSGDPQIVSASKTKMSMVQRHKISGIMARAKKAQEKLSKSKAEKAAKK